MMGPPATPVGTFEITTDNGKMTMCLDHQNWSPYTVYADNSNLPPMCPSKSCYTKSGCIYIPMYLLLLDLMS